MSGQGKKGKSGSNTKNILITNPRDIPGFVKELKKHQFTFISGVNTLFNKLMEEPSFKECDFSKLNISIAGGMPVQKSVGERWQSMTGCLLVVGYCWEMRFGIGCNSQYTFETRPTVPNSR